jgi:hypothetical protein
MCSLRFENNLLAIEGVRFASISKKTPLSKLSFAFVSLALPLLDTALHLLYQRAVRQKFSTPGISELSVQNIRDSGEMLSKDRCKTTAGFFVIPLLSQL